MGTVLRRWRRRAVVVCASVSMRGARSLTSLTRPGCHVRRRASDTPGGWSWARKA
jgi:hypothetical protein